MMADWNHEDTKCTKQHTKMISVSLCALCALCVFVVYSSAVMAQAGDKADALAKLNEARRQNGVLPLAWNAQLETAAQRHSDDMARGGFVDEVGADGTSSRQRVEASGYAKWPSVRVWGESIYAGQTNFDEALSFFLGDDAQRRALLNPKLREVGIGIAKDRLRTYWTITLGSQPNLLPIFINDGAPVTKDRQVAVQLTQEDAVPQGDGNGIGRVVEVRISDRSDFGNAEWQPWEPLLPFTLDRKTGTKTIYMQMRDGAGKTTIATATIEYDPNSRNVIKPVSPGIVPTPEPTSSTPLPTTTSLVTTASPTSPSTATAIATITPTPTALPNATVVPPTPTAVEIGKPVVADAPSATAPPVPAVASPAAPARTPTSGAVIVFVKPTATPEASTSTSAANEQGVTTVILTPLPEAQTGAQPTRSSGLPDWLLPVYLVAQVAVIAVGLALFIRRK